MTRESENRMNQIYNDSPSYGSGNGGFKRTNYILKEDASKTWPTYSISGTTEIKPYPVFDANGTPCPARMTSPLEADGNVPDAETLSAAEIREYEGAIMPPAFFNFPAVTWVGKDAISFIDYCSDLAQFQNVDERDADKLPPTPYSEMVRVLNGLIPTDRYPGDGKPCPPTLQRSRNAAKGQIGLRSRVQTVLMRGALIKVRGKALETKNSVNGVLWRACLLVSQKSARLSLRNKFSEKADPTKPISAVNFPLAGMFHPAGTCLTFTKSDPMNRQSDIVVKPSYSEAFNRALMETYAATSVEAYYAKIRDELGAFQTIESMLNIMTVQEQIKLIIDQFPAAWVWYGLRDSRYATMIPEEVRRAALKDPEWFDRFGVSAVVAPTQQYPQAQDEIPMTYPQMAAPKVEASGAYVPPAVPRVEEPPAQGFDPKTLLKDAEVTYQPSPDQVVGNILNKYGAQ